jgi:hypothetical protein
VPKTVKCFAKKITEENLVNNLSIRLIMKVLNGFIESTTTIKALIVKEENYEGRNEGRVYRYSVGGSDFNAGFDPGSRDPEELDKGGLLILGTEDGKCHSSSRIPEKYETRK